MNCKNCGKEIDNKINFCPHCGFKLKNKLSKQVLIVFSIALCICVLCFGVEQYHAKSVSYNVKKLNKIEFELDTYLRTHSKTENDIYFTKAFLEYENTVSKLSSCVGEVFDLDIFKKYNIQLDVKSDEAFFIKPELKYLSLTCNTGVGSCFIGFNIDLLKSTYKDKISPCIIEYLTLYQSSILEYWLIAPEPEVFYEKWINNWYQYNSKYPDNPFKNEVNKIIRNYRKYYKQSLK